MPGPLERSRTGLARALSKMGVCSRSQAWEAIKQGRVKVNGSLRTDPEYRVVPGTDRISIDGREIRPAKAIYLMLNKPRGLVTSSADEQGRSTVFQCFEGENFPHMAPVGRLDKASEGLLLFTNDNGWAAHIASPKSAIRKVYHVQVDQIVGGELIEKMQNGVESDGETLAAQKVTLLRSGEKNCWLEIFLNEGKNRHIRRMLQALNVNVLRLIRISIGSLKLGELPKGKFRVLIASEIESLRGE